MVQKYEPSIFEFTEHFLRTTLKFEIPKTDIETQKTDIEISEKEAKTSKKILECIIENPKITSSMLAAKLDISKSATDKQLANLKKLGKIRRVGSTKAGSWDIL